MITNQEEGPSGFFWLSLFVVPLLPWLAYLAGWGLPLAEVGMFSISIFTAVLLRTQEGRVPLTSIRITPKLVVVFWTILTLGPVGGIAVAAAAALAGFSGHRGLSAGRAARAGVDILCAAVAGFAFGGALDLLRFSSSVSLPVSTLVSNDVLAAGAAMLAAYHAAWLVLTFLVRFLPEARIEAAERHADLRLGWHLAGHLTAAVAAITLFAAFGYFGTALALVVVPLTVFAHLAHQIHLYRLKQKTRELADASRIHLSTVEALATAIDARDQVGIGHVRRTQMYAVGIGTVLGLSENELDALRAGALLHDIGKLAVPEYILNKPGRLTSAELEKTKVHATVGASILEKVAFPCPVVPTVKHHHEHWDGSGYPDGLSGDRIPITARILSVADAYDALRGPRPFRSAISREDACNFLRSRSGTQFDPHVVNTFLLNLKRMEAEIEFYGFGYDTENCERDTTDAAESYVAQIKRANQEVFSLYEMARDFGASLNIEETLELLTAKVREFVAYDTCLVYLLDDDETTATALHVEGRNSEILRGKKATVGEGATGYVLKKRKPVENVDPSLDFAFSHAEVCDHYVGMASVPLLAEEKLVGAITVFSGELAVYEEEHLRLLETISRIAADAICKSIKHAETETHAQTDPLTGLPNARGLNIQFEKEIARARRSNSSLQLLMLDLDGFKSVNDTFGHKAGDAMLREIGRIIKLELRDYDFLARYGGDEFVALIPEMDSSDVIELCSRIEAAVGAYASSFEGALSGVGVSVGAAAFPAQGETFEQLLIAADKAMYRTKAFHKQRLVRLGESLEGVGLSAEDQPIQTYIVDGPPVAEIQRTTLSRESDLVVELDESHIVVVNTIN